MFTPTAQFWQQLFKILTALPRSHALYAWRVPSGPFELRICAAIIGWLLSQPRRPTSALRFQRMM